MKVVIIAVALLAVSMIVVNAQAPQVTPANQAAAAPAARGGGRGGGRGAAANNPPPTSPVTGNATIGEAGITTTAVMDAMATTETGRVRGWNNLRLRPGSLLFFD
jgi:hypothetical protein